MGEKLSRLVGLVFRIGARGVYWKLVGAVFRSGGSGSTFINPIVLWRTGSDCFVRNMSERALSIAVMVVASSEAAILSLAGNRNRADGNLNNQGSNGNYWSSGPNGTNAYNLNFNSGGVNPANNNNRANGFSVRCVKD